MGACACLIHPSGFRASVALLCAIFHFQKVSMTFSSRLGMFAGIFESPAALCKCSRVPGTCTCLLGLTGSPMCDSVPLIGGSRVTDVFAVVLEFFFTSPMRHECVHGLSACFDSSRTHPLCLRTTFCCHQVGRRFRVCWTEHVLIHSYVFLSIFM